MQHMVKRPIKRHSLPETLAAELRERILNGEFKEGDQLRQETIAKEYEVSRMPVREALRQLEAEGLVVFHIHRGAVVVELPSDEVAELFDLRAQLEPEVLRHAIPKMTESDFKASQNIVMKLEQAYRDNDVGSWGALNWEFHRSLYEPAGRPRTMALLRPINFQTDRYVRLSLVLSGAIKLAAKEHRELLALCRKRDVRAATTLLRTHILNAKQALLNSVAERTDARTD